MRFCFTVFDEQAARTVVRQTARKDAVVAASPTPPPPAHTREELPRKRGVTRAVHHHLNPYLS